MKNKLLMDGHIHTLACGHAYNTITEMAKAAKDQGMELIVLNEHGPKLTGGANYSFFNNIQAIPPEIDGVKILRGMEANILQEGKLRAGGLENPIIDVFKGFAPKLEVVSASLHAPTFQPKSMAENTEAVMEAIRNPRVDYLCHLGNPRYPLDYEKVVKELAKENKLMEVNNGSFYIRQGSIPNCAKLVRLAKKYDVPVVVGSDAHFASAVGKFPYAEKLLDELEFPEELVMNTNPDKFIEYLKLRGKPVGEIRDNNPEEIFNQIEEAVRAGEA